MNEPAGAERVAADRRPEADRHVEADRRLFDAHPVPMAVWDPATGLILAANDAALAQYGYERSELVDLPVARLVHPDDLPRLGALVRELPSGYAGAELFRHLRKDGTIIGVEVSGHPFEFEGRPARLVLATDVTERRRLEEQLRQAHKMEAVGRLAGGVAHDFNNLLLAIMGFSELLLEKLPENSEERDAADAIHEAGQRAAALTAQLLAFSRPQGTQPERLDLNAVVAGLEPAIVAALGPQIAIELRPLADEPAVMADRAQLEQAIMSCVLNARDAMPDGGRLTIETVDVSEVGARALGGITDDVPHVLLSISDTGVGMNPEVRDRAFDPFFTTKPKGGTTGLGLAMVYAAIQHAGGRVRLESVPHRGSTVRIFLPLAEPDVDAAAPAPAAPATVRPAAGATILVAEDEPAVRALVLHVLRDAGHTVIGAADGIAAIDLAERHDGPIDLLLTDIVMPGPSGIETARRIRAIRPGLRVLYMSGWAADIFKREGVDESEVTLLAKPFSITELVARVDATLRGAAG
jgi:two-component system cell cycle sensor histidine kinase/response regulator CckA